MSTEAAWDELTRAADPGAALLGHLRSLVRAPSAVRALEALCGAVLEVERGEHWGDPALKLSFPAAEDGEVLEDEPPLVLWASLPFAGQAHPSVPASVAALTRVHASLYVEREEDHLACFYGLDEGGRLIARGTLTDPSFEPAYATSLASWGATVDGAAPTVDVLPNGWVVFDPRPSAAEPTLRWVSEELRELGAPLWPELSTGEALLRVFSAVALGWSPVHLARREALGSRRA